MHGVSLVRNTGAHLCPKQKYTEPNVSDESTAGASVAQPAVQLTDIVALPPTACGGNVTFHARGTGVAKANSQPASHSPAAGQPPPLSPPSHMSWLQLPSARGMLKLQPFAALQAAAHEAAVAAGDAAMLQPIEHDGAWHGETSPALER